VEDRPVGSDVVVRRDEIAARAVPDLLVLVMATDDVAARGDVDGDDVVPIVLVAAVRRAGAVADRDLMVRCAVAPAVAAGSRLPAATASTATILAILPITTFPSSPLGLSPYVRRRVCHLPRRGDPLSARPAGVRRSTTRCETHQGRCP
jgi:hypothetical protein